DQFLSAGPYSYSVQIPGCGMWSYTMSETEPRHTCSNTPYPLWTALFQEKEDSITTRIKFLTFAYVITDDRTYAETAKEMVLKLSNWQDWADPDFDSGAVNLYTAHATQSVATFYDWVYLLLTEAERETIRNALITKGILKIQERISASLYDEI